MQTKTLLLVLSVAAFSSCSTAYKSGQTPDDVYYSPVRVVDEKQNDDRENRDRTNYEPAVDYEITMGIRDRRWRDFRDDYDYRNSPYNYISCNCMNHGYYYNPFYYPWAIYTGKPIYSKRVNTTPRMVNLNTYTGYNSKAASDKTNGRVTWANPSTRYNNSNRSNSGSERRISIFPSGNSSSSSNDTRTYSPSSGSSSGGSSSSGSSNSGSVSRPKRGG